MGCQIFGEGLLLASTDELNLSLLITNHFAKFTINCKASMQRFNDKRERETMGNYLFFLFPPSGFS